MSIELLENGPLFITGTFSLDFQRWKDDLRRQQDGALPVRPLGK